MCCNGGETLDSALPLQTGYVELHWVTGSCLYKRIPLRGMHAFRKTYIQCRRNVRGFPQWFKYDAIIVSSDTSRVATWNYTESPAFCLYKRIPQRIKYDAIIMSYQAGGDNINFPPRNCLIPLIKMYVIWEQYGIVGMALASNALVREFKLWVNTVDFIIESGYPVAE